MNAFNADTFCGSNAAKAWRSQFVSEEDDPTAFDFSAFIGGYRG